MAPVKTFSPNIQVVGATVLSLLNGLGPFKVTGEKILAVNGIADLKPDGWYPLQNWLNALKEIAKKMGISTLMAIGKMIPDNAQWPPQIDSIEKGLASIDVAYHMNHRGGDVGYYRFKKTGLQEGKMVCKNPYPSDFDQGIIQAVARRFAAPGTSPTVKLDESAPTRKKGADSCTYLIKW